ncbi:MAG: YiiX/YebB-like N1pC/P60 family cysteine hydrolase [Comamonadaceae bacterium]|nr:lipo-like protein [Burkholderiales bacterium]MEB2348374.1 YiiX/YebB-like N1pC/P60 family cysteine hydrolase [Comamonadaceae bacterium]
MNTLLGHMGAALARYLSHRTHRHDVLSATSGAQLLALLEPGDVLLVDGDTRISTAIKYLTQSSWSHAALYVGHAPFAGTDHADHCFVEADVNDGVRSVGIEEFTQVPTRICRAVGLCDAERQALVRYVVARIGERYDLRNVIDLARYLLPTPPVPARLRRKMIALGSGDPTRAICSTLIAQAFQSIDYPILPIIEYRPAPTSVCPACVDEVLHIRDHSLYTPRDFDVSPYFDIIKPHLAEGFDFRHLVWDRAGKGSTHAAQTQTV